MSRPYFPYLWKGVPSQDLAKTLIVEKLKNLPETAVAFPYGVSSSSKADMEGDLRQLQAGIKAVGIFCEFVSELRKQGRVDADAWCLAWLDGLPVSLGGTASPAVIASVPAAPKEDRFPDTCPSCGKKAYLGGGMRVLHAPDDHEGCL